MALLLTVMTAVSATFLSGTKSEQGIEKRTKTQTDARGALARMREDMHCAYALQAVGPNAAGNGFTLALTEKYNACKAVDSNASGSQVYLSWCTIAIAGKPGVYNLYRENNTCDANGTLIASDIVAPAAGWPTNAAVTSTPASWAGNIWPSSLITCTASQTGYLPTVAVDLAVNSDTVATPNGTYELKDQIALRNATRCNTSGSSGGTGVKVTPTLSLSAPAAGISGTAIAASSIQATLGGSASPTAQITFFAKQAATAPTTCGDGTWTTLGTASPTADGTFSPSGGLSSPTTGTYYWYAAFAGDSGNNAVNSTCGTGMPSTVIAASKATPTLVVAGPSVGTTGVAIAASSITATLGAGNAPTGAIAFYAYGPSATAPASCPGAGGLWASLGSATASGAGTYIPVSGIPSPGAGTYWWYATYAGDSANNAVATSCSGAMSFTPVASGPTLTALDLKDIDHDGKVDQVVATFSSSLAACSGACSTSGWTLSNVPSGGSLSSVTVSGTQATLTLTQGAGAQDTSVGTMTVALGTSAGLKDGSGHAVSFLSTIPADKAAPVPVSMTSTNKAGGTAGKAEAGDKITVTYSEAIATVGGATSTVTLSTSSGNSKPVNVAITNFATGTFAIGNTTNYMAKGSANAVFGTAASSVTKSGAQVTVTLGTWAGAGSLNTGSYAVGATTAFTPDAGIKDAAGNSATGTLPVTITFF